eukprot:CAMPEP_0182457108 /NCGR_PEP_ID=MMETSP1319-20130603/2770_1 /TAXON_ID=172717 /ORGANISM="Bolidomonas pacifica, Strain RCC208" /LENGTH=77 /DNA_ID=CAMNT_0024655507 /DNA_START=61 /DNA_END=290 /DNA_ORIENTATION=-
MEPPPAPSVVDWSSELAKSTVSSCMASKMAAVGSLAGGFNRSLVDIYAAGAEKLGCGVRELARKVVEAEAEQDRVEG